MSEPGPDSIRKTAFPLTRRGIVYDLVADTEHSRIVSATAFGTVWHEVYERRINKAYVIAGNAVPASEAFPGDEAFGKWALTCHALDEAYSHAETLDAKVRARLLARAEAADAETLAATDDGDDSSTDTANASISGGETPKTPDL